MKQLLECLHCKHQFEGYFSDTCPKNCTKETMFKGHKISVRYYDGRDGYGARWFAFIDGEDVAIENQTALGAQIAAHDFIREAEKFAEQEERAARRLLAQIRREDRKAGGR